MEGIVGNNGIWQTRQTGMHSSKVLKVQVLETVLLGLNLVSIVC